MDAERINKPLSRKLRIKHGNGRSSDLLAFEAFPFLRKVTVGFKSSYELTAAGTVQVLHLLPYYAIQSVRWIWHHCFGKSMYYLEYSIILVGE